MATQHYVPLGRNWIARTASMPSILAVVDAQRPIHNLSGRIVHRHWALDYTFTDAGFYRVVSLDQPWEKRMAHVAHLYPPGCPYWQDLRGVKELHSAYIVFQSGDTPCLNALVNNPKHFARFTDPAGLLGQRLQQIAQTERMFGENGFWQAHALLYSILDMLVRAPQTGENTRQLSQPASPSQEMSMTATVRAYLEKNISKRVSLDQIAEHLNVSVSFLSHRYKSAAGETPMDTRSQIAIKTAKGLLLKGYPLKYIAAETGFCDAYHLSKAFKRAEGLSPRAYLHSLDAHCQAL